jgi:hypothetical protein
MKAFRSQTLAGRPSICCIESLENRRFFSVAAPVATSPSPVPDAAAIAPLRRRGSAPHGVGDFNGFFLTGGVTLGGSLDIVVGKGGVLKYTLVVEEGYVSDATGALGTISKRGKFSFSVDDAATKHNQTTLNGTFSANYASISGKFTYGSHSGTFTFKLGN